MTSRAAKAAGAAAAEAIDQAPGPLRTCVGCRRRSAAGNLVRVARDVDGSLVVSRVAPGRGAWLCQDPGTTGPAASCLAEAVRRNAFSRAFRMDVTVADAAPLNGAGGGRETMETHQQYLEQ